MSKGVQAPAGGWLRIWLSNRLAELRRREHQVILVLALVIGALTGSAVVAFLLLTGRLGVRPYPLGGEPGRALLFPGRGSPAIRLLAYRSFSHSPRHRWPST